VFSSEPPIYKEDMINAAKEHKLEAWKALDCADNICIYIPNLEKRQHMHTLITSSIGAASISNPRDKLLAVGLALIGSMAMDAYDQYCSMRYYLGSATAHF